VKPSTKAALWASLARLIGVVLGAGAGNIIHTAVGGGFNAWPVALGMAVVSFVLMWYSETQREEVRLYAKGTRKIRGNQKRNAGRKE
jgi:uncharacterized membrane protein YgaE (UPF0421/DUF939 family)